ncbi:MAG TPA: hypothetical protein DCS07_03070 [Bdellovibrionales bacterium]|nr:hypothetical protein [Bdellovibrionales bacterium]
MKLLSATAALCAIMLLSSCAALTPTGRKVREADGLFQDRKYSDAAASYRRVIREHSGSTSTAEARFNLARTLAWHDNPQRDYAAALQEFDEFLRAFPDHALAHEARNWRLVLKTVDDLKKSLDQLKKLDIKHEERRKRR